MIWPLVSLSSLVEIKGGGTPSKAEPTYWNGDIPWASVKDFKSSTLSGASDYITQAGIDNSATSLIEKGNIIIPTRMALGKIAINTIDLAINQDLKALIIRDHKKVDLEYLFRCIQSKSDEIIKQGKGATVKGITLDVLNNLQIPLLPIETQKQIAAVLEKADQLRKDCQQMEQELNSLAQSVFIDMFGDPVTNPKGWKAQTLGSISKVQLGKMLSSASKNGINPKKYLRNANVKWRNIEIHDLLEMDFTEKEMGKFQLITGDLLVCEGGEIGRCAIWDGQVEDCYYQKALHRVRLNPEVATAEYIQEYFFWMAKLGGLISSTNEVTFKHLTAEKMNKLEVPLPPIEAQKKFKNIYSSIKSELENNAEQIAQTEMGFQSLMQKAFNGELNLDNAKTQ